ncbi:carboxylesterase [Chitinophaga caeni]|uniref:Carboxylic ester hydrolase n=1 Tax=Chitinophaga caeni TaxID=2029983 RepID=A0A291QY83_9BACT|nr:carboxylesterase family protein [Chitinophaga caeni]ATL48905.1 carboxylesterase [Chitinophaga caeni]
MHSSRRNFIKRIGQSSVLLGAGTVIPGCSLVKQENKDEVQNTLPDEPVLQIGEDIAVVQTDKGKVKGFIMRGIETYLGIPYAADASGKNRFLPPQEHEAWEGIRPSVFYGNSAPQNIYSRAATSYGAFIDHWNYDEISEDCLSLNIWTKAAKSGRNKPVLLWLHGGGYSQGNGIEQDGYHGENFTRYGDVVFCSLNHRLGAIGFSDFSAVDEKFKDSGNVGMLDILAALQWIQKNIANFGGDPNNVTIMGQSGGGAKVCTLASMPAAKGLIHKGVALSGSATHAIPKEYARQLGLYILKEAGLQASGMSTLQEMPWDEYLALSKRAAEKLQRDKPEFGFRRGSFGPVADGHNLPAEGYFSSPQPDIPVLFCSTFHEWSPSRTEPSLENITKEGVIEKLHPNYGDASTKIYEGYDAAFPGLKPIELWAMIVSNRKAVVEAANLKKKQGSPVYMAWFGWCPPLFDGRMRAFHCLDISFWLLNTDLMITHSGGGAKPRALSNKMAEALLQFMKTGNPACKSLPDWPEYTADKGSLMILNDTCKVADDPDRKARLML